MTSEPRQLPRRGMSARLTDVEWRAVTACCSEIRSWPARALISRKAEPLDRSLLLLDGWIGRYVPGPHRDRRELVALEIAGDFVDLHSFPIGTLDHDVAAMTDVRLAVFPHSRLRTLLSERPAVSLSLWAQTILDASIHRYWSYRVGSLRASGRVANFLCEMHSRLELAGMADVDGFDLPLTQIDVGEACGMSAVHVNRVIRELREAGCCTVKDGRVTVFDHGELRRIGQYEPNFLQIGQSVAEA